MRISIIFLGLFGFFAQEFNASYSLGLSVGCTASIIMGVFPSEYLNKYIKLLLLMTILGGAIHHALEYYLSEQVVGSYYGGWIWSVPSVLIGLAIYLKKSPTKEN